MVTVVSPRLVRPSSLAWIAFAVITFFLLRQYWSETSWLNDNWRSGRPGPNGETFAPIYTNKLPKYPSHNLPKIQDRFLIPEWRTLNEQSERGRRGYAVRERFKKCWLSYKKKAFGADELKPISGDPVTSFGGWGATLVDSLSSLWIFGMKDEFEAAVLKTSQINFNETDVDEINVFETTIRYLGGLLGAYDVSGAQYPVLLEKAIEVGELVYGAFDTPNRMPVTRWKLREQTEKRASSWALIAEIGSLNLEFTRLSQLTGNSKYYDAIYRVAKVMDEHQMQTQVPGLWPVVADAETLKFDRNGFSFGGMADSAYEYLPKMHALIGGADSMYQRDYDRAIKAAREHLFFRPMLPGDPDLLYAGSVEMHKGKAYLDPQGQHLTCFAGGMMIMGSKLFGGREVEFDIGRKLTEGCVWSYDSMTTGIMPEVFHMVPCLNNEPCGWDEEKWKQGVLALQGDNEELVGLNDTEKLSKIINDQGLAEGYTKYDNPMYMLRPEAVESLFYLYRTTAIEDYADWAWRMFSAIDKHTRTEFANAGIWDVASKSPEKMDKMESFWFAETLKYFYLIFNHHELVSLDRYVL